MKRILLLLPLLLCSLISQAQELKVKSFAQAAMDLSASTHERKDLNGNACALVKVQLAREGATFKGNVMDDVAYKVSEYWVYMARGSRDMSITVPGFLPLEVNFAELSGGSVARLEGKTTYILTIALPSSATDIAQKSASGAFSAAPSVTKNLTFNVKGVTFNMIFIEGGQFMMGGLNEDSKYKDNDLPVHKVTLSNFYCGQTEVTQALWKAVMGKNPSRWEGMNKPVEQVSWNDCQKFIKKLSKITGRTFRLLTEAEWEYAARGGKMSKGYKYSGSNDLASVAWCSGVGALTQDVATKQPNELGLYDMSGNVSEWCSDCHAKYSDLSQTNPKGPERGELRVMRGGDWSSDATGCCVTFRKRQNPYVSVSKDGLRLALSE